MIAFACSNCGKTFEVKPEFAGRSTRCSACQQPMVVPSAEATQAYETKFSAPATSSSLADVSFKVGVTLVETRSPNAERRSVRELLARPQLPDQRYILDRELARGGMGAVHRAVDCELRREVAVKYLLDQDDARLKSRFVEEAQITGQLEHPNIVPIHELGVDAQQRLFFAMKMVQGRSLAQVVAELRERPGGAAKEYSLGRLLHVVVNICHALAYAHARGVIHRDLKPANVMIGDYGEVYVMDWGLAKVLGDSGAVPSTTEASPFALAPPEEADGGATRVITVREGDSDQTRVGTVLGTPVYMPPEQAAGQVQALDERSDIYSLGAILYELLALAPPVDKSGGYQEVLGRVARGEIVPPEARNPARAQAGQIPRELSAIAMKALARKPDDRYANVIALRRDLELFQEGRSVSAKEDTRWEQLVKFVKRNKGFSIATAGATVLVTAILAVSAVVNYRARRDAEEANANFHKEQLAKEERTRQAVPALVEAARLAVERRRFDDALAQVKLALEYDPDDAEARLLKGQLLIVTKDYQNGVAELEHFLRVRPGDVAARHLRDLCDGAQPGDDGIALMIAQLLSRQQSAALAERLLAPFGPESTAARKTLLSLYRRRIDAAWTGLGNRLALDNDGIFGLDFSLCNQVKLLAPLEGIPLTKLSLANCTDIADLHPLRAMPLDRLDLSRTSVADLTPLQGRPLTWLNLLGCSKVKDLSPLKGMPLADLTLDQSGVQDLAALAGMPLVKLKLASLKISGLEQLRGLSLTHLGFQGCRGVRSLAPLEGMPLIRLEMSACPIRDLSPLRSIPLESLDCTYCVELRDLAPLEQLPLTHCDLRYSSVSDLTPLRGTKLTTLLLHNNPVEDLTPLQKLPLAKLIASECRVRDLAPLRGLPLTYLDLSGNSGIRELSPLRDLSLTALSLRSLSAIRDLGPLEGMPLTTLDLADCAGITQLTSLQYLPITSLTLTGCEAIEDLTPLQRLPLSILRIDRCKKVTDLTALRKMNLTELRFTPQHIAKGMEVVRGMPALQTIFVNGKSYAAKDFWREYDAGNFAR